MKTQPETSIRPQELLDLIVAGRAGELLDVRTPVEFASAHVPGSKLVPLQELDAAAFVKQREKSDRPIYVFCRVGARACKAIEKFQAAGFQNCVLVEGGIEAWTNAGLPVCHAARAAVPVESAVKMHLIIRRFAGVFVLASLLLAYYHSRYWLWFTAFVGFNLVQSSFTNICPLEIILRKLGMGGQTTASCGVK